MPKTKKKKTTIKKPKSKALAKCSECLGWYNPNVSHICMPMTEHDLVADLNEDLGEAWLKLRQFAAELGEQRIYNSPKAIMFSRRTCYMFVRPKKSYLEVCVFLPQKRANVLLKSAVKVSKTKFAHTFRLLHADHIDEPLTDWLRDAYAESDKKT